jgi:hypothetical protein
MESEQARPTLERSLNRVATFIGYGQSKLWMAARALERVGLWQRKPKGRAKPSFPPASCWANLALCLATMQTESPEVAADRVVAFRKLRQVEGERIGLPFGEAVDELFDRAASDIQFRRQVFVWPVTIIDLNPGMVPVAQITIDPVAGKYGGRHGIDAMDVLPISHLMHMAVLGLSCIPRIHGSLINEFAELLAIFREAEAQAKGATSPAREATPSTRPTDKSVAETPRTDDRSLDSSDPIPSACVTAIAQLEGGSPPHGARDDDETGSTDQAST